MKKIQIIPVGPPSTDADALIDSMGVTKEEKERIYKSLYSGKRRLTTVGRPDLMRKRYSGTEIFKGSSGKITSVGGKELLPPTEPFNKRSDKRASKRSRKSA